MSEQPTVLDVEVIEEATGAEYAKITVEEPGQAPPHGRGLLEKNSTTYKSGRLPNGYFKVPTNAPEVVQQKVHDLNSNIYYNRNSSQERRA